VLQATIHAIIIGSHSTHDSADSVHSLPSKLPLDSFKGWRYQSDVDPIRDCSSLNTYCSIGIDLLYNPWSGSRLIHLRGYPRFVVKDLAIDFVAMLDSTLIFFSNAFIYQVLFP